MKTDYKLFRCDKTVEKRALEVNHMEIVTKMVV